MSPVRQMEVLLLGPLQNLYKIFEGTMLINRNLTKFLYKLIKGVSICVVLLMAVNRRIRNVTPNVKNKYSERIHN